jgi:Zn-dependent metalloprotease
MHKKHVAVFAGVFIICCFAASQAAAADTRIMPALASPSKEQPKVSIHRGTGKVRFLAAPAGDSMLQPSFVAPDVDAEGAARTFLGAYGSLFGIGSPEQELVVKKAKRRSIKFRQVYQGLPVLAGELVVNLDQKKNVRSVNGEISPEISLSTTPAFSAKEAKAKALAVVSKKHGIDRESLSVSEKELSVYNPVLIGQSDRNTNYLVWRIEVKSQNGMIREFVLIDAMTGITHLSFNQVDSARNRSIYDNANYPYAGLPGSSPVRIEGGAASAIKDVNDAYDFLGNTYDFYLTNHGRDSIDDAGMGLIATVRYCSPDLPSNYCPYPNAFWNGDQMVFGQGFAAADDVVGHELTHGVTEHESGLFYFMQSGAINESLSDVWGEFIDLTNGRGTDTPNKRWLMGEDIPGVGAIRNLKNPPQFKDPDSMLSSLYSCKSKDNGGVHTNSGVNNKAASLMVDGGTFGGQTIAGVSGASDLEKIQKVAKLYYEVQIGYLTSGSDYQDLADALIQACNDLITTIPQVMTPADCVQVEKAVNAVHMHALPSKCRNIDVPLCSDGSNTDLFFDDLENTVSGNWTSGTIVNTNEWYYPQNPNLFSSDGFDATYATSGVFNIWGYDYGGTINPITGFWNGDGAADFYIAMTSAAQNLIGPLPPNSFMLFNHAYDFEDGTFGGIRIFFDGSVLEYSTNNGATWTDAENLFVINGYDGKLDARFGNPLPGRKAFAGSSRGYITSKLDLSPLAGNTVRFRYRIGTDVFGDGFGWFIDDIRVYTCSEPAPSAVALFSPVDGDTFANGDTVNIQWEGPANMAYANLSYSVDNGATWKTIEKNLQGSSFDWPIPLQSNNKAKSLVKASAYDDKGKLIGTAKSGVFAIEVVRLTAPNGGEPFWDEGSVQTITWVANTTKSPVAKVQLSYSIDNGVSWKSIASDNINDGSLEWILPSVSASKTKSKVKIVLKDDKGSTLGSDISDAPFTIVNIP